MQKPWLPVADAGRLLKGHMGVFQLADARQQVVYIGFAGGRSVRGLRGEVTETSQRLEQAEYFRVEITTSYLSRFRELMMAHIHDHGAPPAANPDTRLGRLSPS